MTTRRPRQISMLGCAAASALLALAAEWTVCEFTLPPSSHPNERPEVILFFCCVTFILGAAVGLTTFLLARFSIVLTPLPLALAIGAIWLFMLTLGFTTAECWPVLPLSVAGLLPSALVACVVSAWNRRRARIEAPN